MFDVHLVYLFLRKSGGVILAKAGSHLICLDLVVSVMIRIA